MLIRQVISCDICGERRRSRPITGLSPASRKENCAPADGTRACAWVPGPSTCMGKTCLHKLVDQFVARNLASRTATEGAIETRPVTNSSLTSKTACVECKTDTSVTSRAVAVVSAKLTGVPVPMVLPIQSAVPADEPRALPGPLIENVPNHASRRWRAEAGERERALHAVERRNENGTPPQDFVIPQPGAPFSSRARRPASSSTGILSSWALSSFDPASSPATT
jgi:hypothetical protein